MTLDEVIKHTKEVEKENQRVVDTGIVFNDVTIDMLYCDDTEVIEEHLANYQRCAEEYRQIAEWLEDYKQLLKQKPILDKIREIVDEWKSDTWTDNLSYECMVKIAELVEPQESEE